MSVNWDDIQDGDNAITLRTRFNNFLNAVASFINGETPEDDQSKWEEDGDFFIRPKDDKAVKASRLEVESALDIPAVVGDMTISRDVTIGSDKDLKITKLAQPTGGFKELYVDDQGKIITSDEVPVTHTLTIQVFVEGSGIPVDGFIQFQGLSGFSNQSILFNEVISLTVPETPTEVTFIIHDLHFNLQPYIGTISSIEDDVSMNVYMLPLGYGGASRTMETATGATKDITAANPIVIANPTVPDNVVFSLPEAAENTGREFTFRKAFTGYSLTVTAVTGTDKIYLNDGDGDVVTTEDNGAWIVLKSDGSNWYVIMDSGNWQIGE